MKKLILILFVIACDPPASTPDAGTDAPAPMLDAAPVESPVNISGASRLVTWQCWRPTEGCPWGPVTSNQAVTWPPAALPNNQRLGYSADWAVYLPSESAGVLEITVYTGKASVYSGRPNQPERFAALAALQNGGRAIVSIPSDMVLSIEGTGDRFEFAVRAVRP